MKRRIALSLLALAGAAAACGNGQAKVEGILIPQADGVVEAEEGDTLAVPADADPAELPLPEGDVVRLAIHRDLPWKKVADLTSRIEAAGKRPVLLVGDFNKVRAIQLEDELKEGERIEVFTYVEGKVCVKPPDIIEAKCAQRSDKKHISRAYTRQFVREMLERDGVHDVLVHAPPELSWADLIRAIDGARTCCGDDTKMRVALAGD